MFSLLGRDNSTVLPSDDVTNLVSSFSVFFVKKIEDIRSYLDDMADDDEDESVSLNNQLPHCLSQLEGYSEAELLKIIQSSKPTSCPGVDPVPTKFVLDYITCFP